jgi:hypothetical protein
VRTVHPAAMCLNSSSVVSLCAHSSADTYLHRLIFLVGGFGEGNRGFFIVFFFVGVNAWGEHGRTAVAVGDGVLAAPTLDVVVFFIAAVKEDSGVWVRSVAGRLASNTRFFSCRKYALKRKSSAHASATVFQNGGSACGFTTSSGSDAIRKVGLWLRHIPKRGRGVEDVTSDARALPASLDVIIGGGIINVIVVAVGDSRSGVGVRSRDDIPDSAIFWGIDSPVASRGGTSGHGRNASG